MKLVSFAAAGRNSYGAVVGDGIVDLGRRLGDRWPTLRSAIAANALDSWRARRRMPRRIRMSQVTCCRRSPIPRRSSARSELSCPRCRSRRAPPENPQCFCAWSTPWCAQPADGTPQDLRRFRLRGELAVVIGKPGRHIAKQDGLSHVCGYACFNDGSIATSNSSIRSRAGKNFHATGGFGPGSHRGRDPRPDAAASGDAAQRHGVQHTGIDDLIFDIPTLISYCSDWTRSWLAM